MLESVPKRLGCPVRSRLHLAAPICGLDFSGDKSNQNAALYGSGASSRRDETMNRILRALLPLRYTPFHPKYWRFVSDFLAFRRLSRIHNRPFTLRWKDRYPVLDERTSETAFEPHYTYHPAWAARVIARTKPAMHVDIASTLHFCGMLSAFVPVEFYDMRPARLTLSNLTSRRADLLSLPFPDESIESISCMHVVEHVGLGRYGDPLDPIGDLKAMAELQRVVAVGGSLLFVVPVGRPCIRYNAHRIYGYEEVAKRFARLRMRQFALIDDEGQFTVDARPGDADSQENGCGCWWFTK